MGKLLKLLVINLGVFILLMLFLELIFRLVNYGPGTQPLDLDDKLHHVHPANYSFTVYDPVNDEYGGHQVTYDEHRRRVAEQQTKAKSEKSIWFLGDSFTEAMQVPYDSTFVGRIQENQKASYNCINFGNSSYSPLIYLIELQDKLSRLAKPEQIIIQLYSNDVGDDERYFANTSYKNNLPIACNAGNTNAFITLARKSYVARNIRRLYWIAKFQKNDKSAALTFRSHVEHSPTIEVDGVFAKHVSAIDSILKTEGIPYCFFVIPSKYASYSSDWETPTFNETFTRFASEQNISSLDVSTAFKNKSQPKEGFFYKDIHLTSVGHRWIAQELNKYIN